LLTPSEDANENLRREGVPAEKIVCVGNIMIDALVTNLPRARQSRVLERLGVRPQQFVYVTLHRPANVDTKDNLRAILSQLKGLARRLPVVFPIHPRTRKRCGEFGIELEAQPGLHVLEPIGYLDSLCLTENARLVLTDSGGLQEESTFFRTPCLTLRPNTERPVTVTLGSNKLTSPGRLPEDLEEVLRREPRLGTVPPLWDGHTAGRVVSALLEKSQINGPI
jgi:UDP-N-acetylglucosamine 2-epimerase (non-hydrolysing)